MPIYRYRAKNQKKSCAWCRNTFEVLLRPGEAPPVRCPHCRAPLKKEFSTFSVGASKSGFDQKAKSKGFHKLKKVDKGKYEKLY